MDKDIIQILWSALLIVIVTIVPLVKKFKEMQRKELRSASAAQPVRQAEADTSAPVSGFRKTAGKSPKTEKAESPLRNQIGISRADAEQQPHSPGIAEEFDVRKAVLYSEIMAPKTGTYAHRHRFPYFSEADTMQNRRMRRILLSELN